MTTPLTVHQFPCLSDNYGFLIRDEATGDVGLHRHRRSRAILAEPKSSAGSWTLILNTHWHPDHAGGNAEIKAATGAPSSARAEVPRIAPSTARWPAATVMLGETASR